MASGHSPLEDIVVRIYLDDKTSLGTGFFLRDDLVVTCYHVLQEPDGSLRKCYYVKGDSTGLIKAKPFRSFKPPIDIAVLQCHEPSSKPVNVVIKAWDGPEGDEFLTRGYDRNTPHNEGANTQEGEMVSRTTLDGEDRLQLRTESETLLQGRSGSPIWSKRQRALVGMVDYWSSKEGISKERSFAIPLEMLSRLGIKIRQEGDLFHVPALPRNFIPRGIDLKKTKEAVLSPEGASAVITGTYKSIGLQGMGGIGKSVLAAALARDEEVRRVFKDGIVWISLGQQADLLQRQLKLIKALEPDHGSVATIAEGLDELRGILRHRCSLIILDDVWKMEQTQAFNSLGPRCRLLFTTRDQSIVRNSGATECRLGILSDEEALELLKLSSDRQDLPDLALDVARECENLPLALAMVGAMVKGRPDDRWENVLHKLRSADLEKIRAEFLDYPYPNLMRAIEVSMDSLEPDQRRSYLDLAVFPEDEAVPERALQVLWGLDRYDTQDLIDLFADRSLATFKDGRLSVHDLQHDFMVKRSGDLRQLHEKLLQGYEERCSDGWPSGPDDGYFFGHLPHHLLEAGKREELRKLLLDFDWMAAKLQFTDVPSLLSDYDPVSSRADLRLIQGAIRLSTHVLFRDPHQLPGQLTGRLKGFESEQIQSLLEQMPSSISYPWLRPLAQTLTPPGGPLIRILQGHTGSVWAVAVTPDGQRAVSGSGDSTLKVWDLESGQMLAEFLGDGPINAIAVTPDGSRIVAGDRTWRVHFLALENLKGKSLGRSAGPREPRRL